MTDPNPRFVSLVKNGAIQQPFLVLKHAQGATPMPIRRPVTVARSEDGKTIVRVRKMVFDKAVFKDEAAVKDYLTKNQYSNYEITSDDNTFTAAAVGAEDVDFANVKRITSEASPGVDFHVGHLTQSGVQREEARKQTVVKKRVAPERQEQEVALKLDWWQMQCARGTTVAEVLESGMETDGVPPGMSEIVAATIRAMGNVLGSEEAGRQAKVSAIASEMADLINAVADVFDTATAVERAQRADNSGMGMDPNGEQGVNEGMGGNRKGTPTTYPRADDATPAPTTSMGEGMGGNRSGTPTSYPRPEVAITINVKKTDNFQKFMTNFAADIELAKKGELLTTNGGSAVTTETKPAPAVTTTAPVVAQRAETASTEQLHDPAKTIAPAVPAQPAAPVIDMGALAALVTKSVSDSIAPLSQRLGELATKVDAQGATIAQVQENAKKTAQTVLAINDRVPTKKSVADQDREDVARRNEQVKAARAAGVMESLSATMGLSRR